MKTCPKCGKFTQFNYYTQTFNCPNPECIENPIYTNTSNFVIPEYASKQALKEMVRRLTDELKESKQEIEYLNRQIIELQAEMIVRRAMSKQ